jgi:cell division protein FtsB
MKKVRYSNENRRTRKSNEENIAIQLLDSGLGKIALVGLSILMLLNVYRSFRQMGQKISLLRQAEQEVESLRLENLELSLKIEEASSIENLEKESRDKLNYGKEGEVVFVIEDELIERGKREVQAILYPQEQNNDIDVLGEWIDFVIEGY